MIADSLHPTRPGEINTGRGNRPSFIARHRVECESVVISMTSFSRIKRSSLLTLSSSGLGLALYLNEVILSSKIVSVEP